MAESLPSGTVTFLFTDVEGSTRLLAEHGERYAELLAEHRRLLRDVFVRHGGVEVDTQGDAFFVAFSRASEAVVAAHEAQQALAETPVRVRIGLHTGEPQSTGEGYVGMDVHRAARIAAAGHGGQVLVSEQTARLLDGEALRDLGVHTLKDVGEARVYQLGEGAFPPLKTLYQTNLPTPAHPLVGRMKELVDVVRLLTIERARAVTLTGPGGTGKTRFSLAVASEVTDSFRDGVWFVDLSAVREPALVVPTIASTLGAQVSLAEHIADRALLVVLDNLEQVVDCAGDLADLLGTCPRLQLLGTSREPLRIAAELEHPLKPLPQSPAVELFRQRARAAGGDGEVDYELASQICDRVDRLPLAIELAAARVKVLQPAALLERLEQRLPVLASRSRDLPERQRTLHSTIAWSYDLLAAEEQQLFRRLAVFAGGSTFEAVEVVCEGDLDLLESLVDKSLLRRRAERYVMLETIREYATERLDESDEAEAVRRRHAEHFLEVALSANLRALDDGPQDHQLVVRDQDNVRAALDWTLARGEIELGLELVIAAENFWVTQSPDEGYRRARAFLEAARDDIPARLRADGLRACASTTYVVGDYEVGTRYIEESLAEYRDLGNDRAVGHMEFRLAVEANRVADTVRARELVLSALESARRTGYWRGETQGLRLLGGLELQRGHSEEGMKLFERSAEVAGEIGFTWWQAGSLLALGEHALELGRLEDAERWTRQGLGLDRQMKNRAGLVHGLAVMAATAARARRPEIAGRLWGAIEAEEARGPIGHWEHYRDEFFATHLAAAGGDAFERGRVVGRTVSLQDAVDEVLAEV